MLVATGADWRYLDDGSSQAVDWRAVGFDDMSWAEGPAPLGYGDADEATVVAFGPDDQAKFPTTYFRHTFGVDNASVLTNFLVRLVRDDGALVYLNGVEIFRSNMPDGDVSYDDFAVEAVGGDDPVSDENYLVGLKDPPGRWEASARHWPSSEPRRHLGAAVIRAVCGACLS